MKDSFTEEDKAKVIDFLNHVATHAELTHDVKGAIDFVKLLSHIQQVVLPKIDNHILEVKKMHMPKKDKGSKL